MATDTLNLQVSAGANDVRSNTGGLYQDTETMHHIGKLGGTDYWGGFRFTSVNIPQGTTILSAFLLLYNKQVGSGTTVNSIWACDDVDNSAAWGSSARPDQRTLTTANTAKNFTVSQWTGGAVGFKIDPIDVTSAVQEVIDRPGWSSGNALSVIGHDNGSTGSNTYIAYATYEDNTAYAAKLFITYADDGAYSNGYTYMKEITITNGVAESFTDFQFPYLISDSTKLNFNRITSFSGNDIIFTDSSDVALDFERATFDYDNNKAEFHIKVPSIPSSGTATIRMYYNKFGDSDHSNAANTWPSATFGLVFHGNKISGTSNWRDSSGNNLTYAQTGAAITEVDGKLGKAASVTGAASNYIQASDNTAVDTTDFTVLFLAKGTDYGSGRRRIYNQQSGDYVIAGFNSNLLELGSSKDGILTTKGSDLSDNAWHSHTVVRDTTANLGSWYNDGALATSGTQAANNNDQYAIASVIRIFAYAQGDSEQPAGTFDELRFDKVARSANYIAFWHDCVIDQDRDTTGSEQYYSPGGGPGPSAFIPKIIIY